MAQADESKSSLPGILGPTLVVALLSAAGYLGYQPELKSARPRLAKKTQVPPPPSPSAMKAEHARLWDDPLSVAYEASQRILKETQTSERHCAKCEALRATYISELQQELAEVVKGLTSGETGADPPQPKRFLVMPVLVPGEPFEDDTERRKRITYAVLSALAVSDFHFQYADRLTYIQVPVCLFDRPSQSQMPVNLVVPMKLFVPGPSPSTNSPPERCAPQYGGVIVCWINQSQLGSRLLTVLNQVLSMMFKGAAKQPRAELDLCVIGPADSDMLQDMVLEEGETWSRCSAFTRDARGRISGRSKRRTLSSSIASRERSRTWLIPTSRPIPTRPWRPA
jgi:hypothetical protein